jgi:hypothetical protein
VQRPEGRQCIGTAQWQSVAQSVQISPFIRRHSISNIIGIFGCNMRVFWASCVSRRVPPISFQKKLNGLIIEFCAIDSTEAMAFENSLSSSTQFLDHIPDKLEECLAN